MSNYFHILSFFVFLYLSFTSVCIYATCISVCFANILCCFLIVNYLQGTWLPTLRSLVAQINETFSRNFQEMAVAGEVLLGIYHSALHHLEVFFFYYFILNFCNFMFLLRWAWNGLRPIWDTYKSKIQVISILFPFLYFHSATTSRFKLGSVI